MSRNFARSRWVQFNGKVLEANLLENGIGYEHLPETGGKILAETRRFESRRRTHFGNRFGSADGDDVFGIKAFDNA